MKLKYINEIKKLESLPKVVNLFSKKEIQNILEFYGSLPITVHNKKQNVIKKRWIQNYNKNLDNFYISKLKEVLNDFKMDNLKSEKGEDFFGLLQESFSPIKLHVDSGFDENSIIYKQTLVPLTPFGETVIFQNRWYDGSTMLTNNKDELKIKPKHKGQNDRSSKHLNLYNNENFDPVVHKKYLSHIDINNLKGLKTLMIYKWKLGDILIFDRTNIHCSSCNIEKHKIGLTTFTKK
tara:strand:- start:178 stop:885 length:708 start_codon:yes stop_codon:yes gene_type:complete